MLNPNILIIFKTIFMKHSIKLSKDLLIVLAANKRRKKMIEFVPKVKGIKIDKKQFEVKVRSLRTTSTSLLEAEALYA
jgi:hypothetical protein